MTSREPTPPIHDALVARLMADARPVRRLWTLRWRLGLWVAAAVAVLGIAAGAGLRDDLATQLLRARYLLEFGLLVGAAVGAATAALQTAVPGRDPRQALSVAAALALLGTAALASEPASGAGTLGAGVRCAACIAVFGLLPWILLFVAVGRAAPLDGRAAGAYVGAAAFTIGAASVRLACPIDDHAHLLAWHVVPVLGWTALSALAGATWLVRWRRLS